MLMWCLQVTEFDIVRREFTSWSQQFTDNLPVTWSRRQNRIRRLFYHPHQCERIFVCDDEAFCIIDKSQVLANCIYDEKYFCVDGSEEWY